MWHRSVDIILCQGEGVEEFWGNGDLLFCGDAKFLSQYQRENKIQDLED